MTQQQPPAPAATGKSSFHKNALPTGFLLGGIYRIQAILGHGGFGITYLAIDEAVNKRVAIKEYLPNEFAVRSPDRRVVAKSEQDRKTFLWGLDRFALEARTLERFNHPNIARVLRFLRLHGTAYLVMEYRDGMTLKAYMAKHHNQPLDEAQIRHIFLPILDGLRAVHQEGLLHRDVKPDNIFLRGDTLSPMLIDFGSARFALGEKSRSLSIVVSAGYAPFEQYSSAGNQGPWTDVYAVGASIYLCIKGQAPPEASQRGSALLDGEPDPYQPLADQFSDGRYSEQTLRSIDDALAFRVKDRLQSAWKFQRLLKGDSDWQPEQAIQIDTDRPTPAPSTAQAAAEQTPTPRRTPRRRLGLTLAAAAATLAAAGWALFHSVDRPLIDFDHFGTVLSSQTAPQAGDETLKAEFRAFDAADRKGTSEAYRAYLADCSLCIDAPLARQRLAALQHASPPPARTAIESARQQGTREAYRGYLDQCAPQCADAETARRLIAILPELVSIRGGRFRMGSDDREPERHRDERRHWVRVLDFFLGKKEITNAEYVHFLNDTGHRGDPERPWLQDNGEDPDSRIVNSNGRYRVMPGYEHHPVTEISWYGANAYAEWLSRLTGHRYRLPTEAEWEYAARAGTRTPFYAGPCITPIEANYDNRASYGDCRLDSSRFIGAPTPVGSYPHNPWGLDDMIGNVMEWSCSQYHPGYRGEEQRCANRPTLPSLRGGAWNSPPAALRTAARHKNFAGYRNNTVGFRVVKEVSTAPLPNVRPQQTLAAHKDPR